MADGEDVAIRFGASVAGAESGISDLKAALLGLTSEVGGLKSAVQAQTQATVDGLKRQGEEAKRTTGEVSRLEAGFRRVGERILEYFTIREIVEWASKVGEAGEQLEHMSQRLNLTTSSLVELKTGAQVSGVDFDRLGQAVGRLDMNFARAREGGKQQIAAFNELGISVQQNYSQHQLLQAVLAKWPTLAPGIQQNAVAMQLFGRAGAELIPFLNMGAAGLAQIDELTAKYGLDNKAAQETSAGLGEALQEQKMAFSGLSNIIVQELGPSMVQLVRDVNDLISGWIKSYQAGGQVKQNLDALTVAFKYTADIVAFLGLTAQSVFNTIDGAAWAAAGVIDVAFGAIIESVGTVIHAFQNLGLVIFDVLTGHWGQIQADVRAGLDRISADVRKTAGEIQQTLSTAFSNAGRDFGNVNKDWAAAATWEKGFMGGGKSSGSPFSKLGGAGGGEETSGLPGKGAGKGPDEVSVWQEQLHAQEIASGEFFKDQTAMELAFWQAKLGLTAAGSKDWLAVQEKIYQASKTLAHQAYDEHLAVLNEQLQADRDNWSKEQGDWQAKLDFIKAHYGAESKEYLDAQRQYEAAEQAHQAKLTEAANKGVQDRLAALKRALSDQDAIEKQHEATQLAAIQQAQQEGAISAVRAAQLEGQAKSDEIARIIADLNAYHVAQDQGLAEELANAERTWGQESNQYKALLDSRRQADAEYYADRKKLDDQAAQQMTQNQLKVQSAWYSTINPMVSSFGSGIQRMIEGTGSLRQALAGVASTILGTVMQAIEQWITRQIVAAITGKAVSATTTASEITAAAGLAAANTFASIAAIPIVGPELAPAAAAASFAEVMAFNVASAAGGWGNVPMDDMPTFLHRNEMVLPASLANPMRSMLGSGGDGAAAGAQRGGDTHFHIHAIDTMTGVSWLRRNIGEIADGLRNQYRYGAAAV